MRREIARQRLQTLVAAGKAGGGKTFGHIDIKMARHHDVCMRTTLTLDPDVAVKARKGAARLHRPFKEIINSALRIGLDEVLKPPAAKPYRTKARPLGLRDGLNYDNIGELLARAEGEGHP